MVNTCKRPDTEAGTPALYLRGPTLDPQAVWDLGSPWVCPVNPYGFTLSQATKALRESRGIALLYFRPLH